MTPRRPAATWNTAALDHPTVLDLPDPPAASPEPLHRLGRLALARTRADLGPQASRLLAQLASYGVVAIRASGHAWEIRELVDRWVLATAANPIDPRTLAVAARLRATRLARQRQAQPAIRP